MKKKFKFKMIHNDEELSEPTNSEEQTVKLDRKKEFMDVIKESDELAKMCKSISSNQLAFLKKRKK